MFKSAYIDAKSSKRENAKISKLQLRRAGKKNGNNIGYEELMQNRWNPGIISSPVQEDITQSKFKRKRIENYNDTSKQDLNPKSSNDARYLISSTGMECFGDMTSNGILGNHLTIMTTILHMSMLRHDYDTAYNAFSLLIRCKPTHIRSLCWIGLEILTRQREQQFLLELKNKNLSNTPDNSLSEYELRTQSYDVFSSHKDEDYLEWLNSEYSGLRLPPSNFSREILTSFNFFPYLIISKLRSGNIDNALEKLNAASLIPVHRENPVCYALFAVATLYKLHSIVRPSLQSDEKRDENGYTLDPNTHKIKTLVKQIRSSINECEKWGGKCPKEFMEMEIEKCISPYKDKLGIEELEEELEIGDMDHDQQESNRDLDPELVTSTLNFDPLPSSAPFHNNIEPTDIKDEFDSPSWNFNNKPRNLDSGEEGSD